MLLKFLFYQHKSHELLPLSNKMLNFWLNYFLLTFSLLKMPKPKLLLRADLQGQPSRLKRLPTLHIAKFDRYLSLSSIHVELFELQLTKLSTLQTEKFLKKNQNKQFFQIILLILFKVEFFYYFLPHSLTIH